MKEITIAKARTLGRYALAVVSNAHPARKLKGGDFACYMLLRVAEDEGPNLFS